MRQVATKNEQHPSAAVSSDKWQERIRDAIAHASHLLPAQGPITTFVHHNTLHQFEDLPFEEAVERAADVYQCHPYLCEERYREELETGRIGFDDLEAVLREDLGDRANEVIGQLTTRYELRLAMLKHPLRFGTDAELQWFIEEAEALRSFLPQTEAATRQALMRSTQAWLETSTCDSNANINPEIRAIAERQKKRLAKPSGGASDDIRWRTPTLEILWRICCEGVKAVASHERKQTRSTTARHAELLFKSTNEDADRLVNQMLIRFCANFLDQGFARWALPDRDAGFWRSFMSLYRDARPIESWMTNLPQELKRIDNGVLSPIESIRESLDMLGVQNHEMQEYIDQTLLALRGWAGMIWQMESNAEWTVRPAPQGSLVEYLAIRLVLERVAMNDILERSGLRFPLPKLRPHLAIDGEHSGQHRDLHGAFPVFQLAQWLGWGPDKLAQSSEEDWAALVHEIEQFSSRERRRVFHLAYEHNYRNQSLNAVASHIRTQAIGRKRQVSANESSNRPCYQVVCCIDEREESFRRHLEEVDPESETYGFAGFFGIAMYYRGATEAHFHPLCPVVVKPKHYVQEEPLFSFDEASRVQAETRRRIGHAAHRAHLGSRTFVGGLLAGLLGASATIPLVMRILFPRISARTMRLFSHLVTPAATRLRIERIDEQPGPKNGQLGYSLAEMASIVESVLRAMGLTTRFARLVIFVGHGSSSLNNPHEAAHDCGACSGGRGGPLHKWRMNPGCELSLRRTD